MADINSIVVQARSLREGIDRLLRSSAYREFCDLSGLEINYRDSEQLFLLNELQSIMEKLDDVEDARAAAFRLHIPHDVFNFTNCFQAEVVEPFVRSYEAGETPNPCVECNRKLKFGALLRRAGELGWGNVATGHYARLDYDAGSGRWLLT